jgi:hypothetical protein
VFSFGYIEQASGATGKSDRTRSLTLFGLDTENDLEIIKCCIHMELIPFYHTNLKLPQRDTMTQPNGMKLSKTRSPGEAGGDNPCNNHAVGTRSVFQNLLDNVRMLSKEKFFGSILISMDKVPAMEDEIRRLKEEEKLSNKSQRQLLETFNQNRDDLRAKHEQLVQEKTGLKEEIMHKVESAKAHEAIRKQQADQIQLLRKSEETTKDDLDRALKQVQGLIKAIEAEKQKSRSLQA